jgi:cysteine desulfurase
MSKLVYLDHNATTFVYDNVVKLMQKLYSDQTLGNPSSHHCMGGYSRDVLERARDDVGKCLHVPASHVIFTSGSTESINMFLLGRARLVKPNERVRFITSDSEHPAVTNTFRYMERTMSPQIEVCILPTHKGLVQEKELYQVLHKKDRRVDTVSISYVNHELGSVLVKLGEIVEKCHKYGALVHSDMTQAIGKLDVNMEELGIDAVSFSGHKFHGPMGVGCLVVSPDVKLEQLMFGGDQEGKRRPGTQNVVGACGMAAALQKSLVEYPQHRKQYVLFRSKILDALRPFPFILNSSSDQMSTTMSISLANVDATLLVEALNQHQICISKGTACKAYSKDGSNVIKSLHLPEEYVNGTIRISFGETTTLHDVETFIKNLVHYLHNQVL